MAARPRLYVFPISHYCEKARWALERLDIEHVVQPVAPVHHAMIAKRHGAPRSSVPMLLARGELVQGSGAIVDWADRATPAASKRLTPEKHRDECLAIEQRLDRVAGVHVRRCYYSEALTEHADTVRPLFQRDLALPWQLAVRAAWAPLRRLMIGGMDLGPSQGRESGAIVERELDWLDGLLADGRRYLVGNRLTRADLAAASLLAPLALPDSHPVYRALTLPPRLADDVARWEQRRALQWVRETYARHRPASSR